MTNELLLIVTAIFLYGSVLVWYRIFGKKGLYCFSAIATILANIEVLILVRAFGIEQTLGNILFAVTFVITDILSENEGKEAAKTAVRLSICASITMIVVTQLWLLYTPSENDWASESIHTIFSNTPRLIFSSLIVFAIVQYIDVFIYHKIWAITNEKSKDKKKYLWIRNNGSTMTSQLINTILFNLLAFGGIYDPKTLTSIILSGYLIFFVTSLLDTPVVYLARKIHEKHLINDES